MSNEIQRDGVASATAENSEIVRCISERAHAHGFELSADQLKVAQHFERLYRNLLELERLENSFMGFFTRAPQIQGIYLWGGVGRGKTFLMNAFFNCLPFERKRRIHFHRFMQEIHAGLSKHQGIENPLTVIARELSRQTQLLCLDEFHITDITDAMLMRRLLEGLFENNVVLVTTSNQHPDDLYLHGLQRSQFLPAIELIKQRLDVVAMAGATDYRLRELTRAGVYHIGGQAAGLLEEAYNKIAEDEAEESTNLEIEGRTIQARRNASGVVWFDFKELCDGPRGKPDYIELARRYHTVIISDIPFFSHQQSDVARRFTWLIDEFYDRGVKLIVSAAALPDRLYRDAGQGDQFQRAVSRLTEMQSNTYLSAPHLP